MAYRHSQDTDGKRTQQEEVEIIGCQTDRGVTTYIVRTQDGIELRFYCDAELWDQIS